MSLLVSCEAGGSLAPPSLDPLAAADGQLDSSGQQLRWTGEPASAWGCDQAARYAAQRIADRLQVRLIANPYSLELIDVTRSLRHRNLFSPRTRAWPAEVRQALIDQIHQPYRRQIRDAIESALARYNFLLHVSVRTFDLRRNGNIRRADAGLLYDASVDDEVDLCLDWIDEMYETVPMLRVRRNYPRRGTADSLTKAMRAEYSSRRYLGIELLLNRAWAQRDVAVRDEVLDGICWSLESTLGISESQAA